MFFRSSVKWWAQLIEIDLKNIADFFSRKTLAKQAFADATLELRNDSQMAEDIMESISTMMNMKVEAVRVNSNYSTYLYHS